MAAAEMHSPCGLKRDSKCHSACISARYVLSALSLAATSLESAHRACINITIVAMVNHTSVEVPTANTTDHYCPDLQADHEQRTYQTGKYPWNSTIQGIILGAYYYGFMCSPLLGGRLAEIFGGKWLLGSAMFMSSLLCFITPSAADIGVGAVVSSRVIMGFLHGTCLPTVFAMFSKWAPVEERTTLLCFSKIGDFVGLILSLLLSGYLCEKGFAGGWPSAFYVQGILGCTWFVFWIILVHNSPDEHPRISDKELEYIKRNQNFASEKKKVPWKDIVTSVPVWTTSVTLFTASWGYVLFMTKLPTYFSLVLHVPIKENTMFNSLAYFLSAILMLLSGYASDFLIFKECCSTTTARKCFHFVAMAGTSILTSLFPFAACNKTTNVILLVLAMAFNGLIGGGIFPVPMDMAPQYAGTIYGLTSGIGFTAGILSPLVAGLMLDSEGDSKSQWNLVFYSAAGISFLSALTFTLAASAEVQPWAREGSEQNNVNKKLPSNVQKTGAV